MSEFSLSPVESLPDTSLCIPRFGTYSVLQVLRPQWRCLCTASGRLRSCVPATYYPSCPIQLFTNVHHEDRNSHPFSLDRKDGLLSSFHGDDYKGHLNQLFQNQISDSVNEPRTENKLERLKKEVTYWDTFSEACARTNVTAVFDVGVCGSAAVGSPGSPVRIYPP